MFGFIKKQLKKIYSHITNKLSGLFSQTKIDQTTLHELKKILLEADTGVQTTNTIIEKLTKAAQSQKIETGAHLQQELHNVLLEILEKNAYTKAPVVYLLVGINGSGKTTCAAKLAHYWKQHNKKVLLVAADTFRAAAQEQLASWAHKLDISIVLGKENQDPASVVYQGCEKFLQDTYDILIIDTAGRLQTKVNLMKELEKIGRIVTKKLPDAQMATLLTVDSMLGQNSLDQAKLFHESTKLDGIILTKMDGTGKGGIVFAISDQLNVPVSYITYGENVEAIKPFGPTDYVSDLLNNA